MIRMCSASAPAATAIARAPRANALYADSTASLTAVMASASIHTPHETYPRNATRNQQQSAQSANDIDSSHVGEWRSQALQSRIAKCTTGARYTLGILPRRSDEAASEGIHVQPSADTDDFCPHENAADHSAPDEMPHIMERESASGVPPGRHLVQVYWRHACRESLRILSML